MSNQYKRLREIGKGGMATVYLARHLTEHRLVALKVLDDIILHDDEYIKRFFREARITAQLDHPNIIKIIESNYSKGECYIVTEYVPGGDLRKVLINQRISLVRKLKIINKIIDALDYAHKKGIVHRDIKPSNILLTKEWEPKLCDFGIATALWGKESRITRTNETMGTVDYIAPEQRESSKNVDFRADIYSIGVILYQAAAGRKPMGAFPRPIEVAPSIPERLDACIMKCLQPLPIKRYKNTQNLFTELEDIIQLPSLLPEDPSSFFISGNRTNLTSPSFRSTGDETSTGSHRDVVTEIVDSPPIPAKPSKLSKPQEHPTGQSSVSVNDTVSLDGIVSTLRDGTLTQKLNYKSRLLDVVGVEHQDKLIEILKESDGVLKETVIEALGKIKSKKSCPYLIELLNDPYYNKNAAIAIGEIGCKEAEYKLHNILITNSANSYIALLPLGRLNSVKSVKAIAGFLDNQHPWIRGLALDALAMIQSDATNIYRYIDAVSRRDDNAQIRAKAKKILWRLQK